MDPGSEICRGTFKDFFSNVEHMNWRTSEASHLWPVSRAWFWTLEGFQY